MIASFWTEGKFKTTLCYTVKELPVTLGQIKHEVLNDEFIRQTKIKTKICKRDQQTSDIFSQCDEVLLYSEQGIIPTTLQKRILKDFHAGHTGIMYSYVYWPNMNKDIENIVKSCKGWALAAKATPIKYSPWPKTDRPWSWIQKDFAGPLDRFYSTKSWGKTKMASEETGPRPHKYWPSVES